MHILLTKLQRARWALADTVAQVIVDARTAEHMEAPTDEMALAW